jgi:hypothetical protein
MSDTGPSAEPMYKYVDGHLVELTAEEIAEIEAERANMPAPKEEPPQ